MSTKFCLIFCIITPLFGTIIGPKSRYYKNRRWFIKNENFQHILQFTAPRTHPSKPFNVSGTKSFTNANCSHSNCIVTNNPKYFKSLKFFDAIIFHGPDFWYYPSLLDNLPSPKERVQTQKYIYYSAESAGNYPFCDDELDGFFNFTWTFRLDSDLPAPYLIIRDNNGTIIGPRKEMQWNKIQDMVSIDNDIEKKLETKTKAVAWLVSICKTQSKRENFVERLKFELSSNGLDLDIFGKCGTSQYKCGRPDLWLPDCWEMFEMDYYFYLSFENSFDEDYVTEKLLNPLQHYVVPIVYGGANYSRFLPDGSYLNAKELGVNKLAKEIINIINDKQRYYSFFKWHNHYSYHSPHETPQTHPLCALCSALNKETRKKTYEEFRRWWNLPGVCPTTLPPTAEQFEFL